MSDASKAIASRYHVYMGMARQYRLIHGPSGIVVARNVERADNPIAEGIGLLGRRGLEPDHGLWLPNTPYVHTLGMRFAIDALFLDRGGRCVRLIADLAPGCWLCGSAQATGCVELPAGALRRAGLPHEGETWLLEQVA